MESIQKRIERMERHYDSHREDYSKFINRRIIMGYANEISDLTAPRFRRAKRIEDRSLPPEAVELWGASYSGEQVHQEAIRRLAAKLESRYLRPGFNTVHDLVPHVPQWWFDPNRREELIEGLSKEIDGFLERVARRSKEVGQRNGS